jgi:hypothetical protein
MFHHQQGLGNTRVDEVAIQAHQDAKRRGDKAERRAQAKVSAKTGTASEPSPGKIKDEPKRGTEGTRDTNSAENMGAEEDECQAQFGYPVMGEWKGDTWSVSRGSATTIEQSPNGSVAEERIRTHMHGPTSEE